MVMIARRRFIIGLATAAEGTDWRFLNELKRELKA
jgi:hypothetical protein